MTDILVDLDNCDREPIHIPGSIQAHGLMLIADRVGQIIRQVAGDVERRLGGPCHIGLPLATLLGEALATQIATVTGSHVSGDFIGQFRDTDGMQLDVSAHQSGPYIVVELEPASADLPPASLASWVMDRLGAAVASFQRAATVAALCERAAVEFRSVTGFDRVLVYQFLEEDAGRVVAEDRNDAFPSFLHHHFPASDIPRQARALYVRNLIRVIPDVTYQPVMLRPEIEGPPLDMSDSSLRSVSPIHLQYMRNMGAGASASVSIVKDDVLWGLIACHNKTPRLMTFDVRMTCRALAGTLAMQIKAKEEGESYRQRIRLRGIEDEIIRLISREDSLDLAMADHLDELSRMLGADGVAVLRGDNLVMGGACPQPNQVRELAAWIVRRRPETVFSTDRLGEVYPPAQAFREHGSGMLALMVSADEPWLLLWFRAEHIEVVNWAGNPHKTVSPESTTQLGPRASFEAWGETVRGRARRWTLPEAETATRLKNAMLDVQQTRQVHELNRKLTDVLRHKDILLEQKEFLIGEVNHRVQNSLQLVSSFLSMQARVSDSIELQESLEEARRRLSAVALVHHRLYRGDQVQLIDIARYIEELCVDTLSSMGQEWAPFLSLDLAPLTVSTDQAIPMGLVLTELIININKFAYAGKVGPIGISLIEETNKFQLIVADRGSGKTSSRKGFGTRMMGALVTQLGGTIAYEDNEPGLRAVLTAPIERPVAV